MGDSAPQYVPLPSWTYGKSINITYRRTLKDIDRMIIHQHLNNLYSINLLFITVEGTAGWVIASTFSTLLHLFCWAALASGMIFANVSNGHCAERNINQSIARSTCDNILNLILRYYNLILCRLTGVSLVHVRRLQNNQLQEFIYFAL